MTMPVVSELPIRLSWHRSLTTRAATGVALLLVRLPPRRLARVLTALSARSRPATATEADAARRAAVTVSARCAGQGCLQRSVATALLCRLGGSWPDWCAGFRTQPFRAHAWVEVDGVPVGEGGDVALFRTALRVRRRAGGAGRAGVRG